MNDRLQYWFSAKRYGWGWGLPTAWQGWVVMLGFVALLLAGGHWLIPSLEEVIFLGYTLLLCALLLVICWLKGEPPRWRWGKD
jgi:hypothetical protein